MQVLDSYSVMVIQENNTSSNSGSLEKQRNTQICCKVELAQEKVILNTAMLEQILKKVQQALITLL
jgi:hypothetical protein